MRSAGINPPENTMELAHAKVVKVSSSGRFETVLLTHVGEITTVQLTEITEAAAPLVGFKNASLLE